MVRCSICKNPNAHAINTALLDEVSPGEVAARYGLNQATVYRHRANCLFTGKVPPAPEGKKESGANKKKGGQATSSAAGVAPLVLPVLRVQAENHQASGEVQDGKDSADLVRLNRPTTVFEDLMGVYRDLLAAARALRAEGDFAGESGALEKAAKVRSLAQKHYSDEDIKGEAQETQETLLERIKKASEVVMPIQWEIGVKRE